MSQKFAMLFLLILAPNASLAAPYEFFALGVPAGAVGSTAFNVSADGKVVVGQVEFTTSAEAYYWTKGTGTVLLGDLPGGNIVSGAVDVSGNGLVIVGSGTTGPFIGSPNSGIEGFWWSESTGMLPMGDLPTGSYQSAAFSVSTDGRVAVGRSAISQASRAFRWSPGGGMQDLGNISGLNSQQSEAFSTSDDGEVVVGRVIDGALNRAFRWTPDLGMHYLVDGDELANFSEAFAVSGDGRVVVGRTSGYSPGTEMFRWTQETGFARLGKLDVGEAIPENTNQNGSILVGAVYGIPGFSSAFIWDEIHGHGDLREMLVDVYGLGDVLEGWTLREANGISADGRVIAGWGINPARLRESWVVQIVPEPMAVGMLGSALGIVSVCLRRRSSPLFSQVVPILVRN